MQKKQPIIQPSSKILKRKRRRKIMKLSVIVIIPVLIVAGLWYLTHFSAISIQTVVVTGNATVDTQSIQQVAKDDIAGNYWLIFSKSNTFLFPRNQIESDILAKYKMVESVSASIDSNQSIKIEISERKPYAVWCDADPIADATGTSVSPDCYFFDDQGYIFSAAPQFSGSVFMKYYGGLPANQDAIGQTFLSPKQFKAFEGLFGLLGQINIKPVAVNIVDTAQFKILTDANVTLIFNFADQYDATVSDLETLLQQNQMGTDALPYSQIDYIDLRFGNKIYYKLRTDEPSSSLGMATTSTRAQ